MHPHKLTDKELIKSMLLVKENVPDDVQELINRFQKKEETIKELEEDILDLENPNY